MNYKIKKVMPLSVKLIISKISTCIDAIRFNFEGKHYVIDKTTGEKVSIGKHCNGKYFVYTTLRDMTFEFSSNIEFLSDAYIEATEVANDEIYSNS